MGGGAKRVTVGYKYYLGAALSICHGIVDVFSMIRVDKKVVVYPVLAEGTVYINQPNIFGGEKREGGIQGNVTLYSGNYIQSRNSYLQSRLGATVPAHRGIAYAVLNQVYVGINPYLRSWSFKATRISKRSDNSAQWYPETSYVVGGSQGTNDIHSNYVSGYSYKWLQYSAGVRPSGWETVSFNDSAWTTAYTPNGEPAGTPPNDVLFRFKCKFAFPFKMQIQCSADDTARFYVNGNYVGLVTDSSSPQTFNVNPAFVVDGENLIAIDGDNVYNTRWIIRRVVDSYYDMNPAHIIRECLTDGLWGLNQSESDIDDVSFEASADTLYAEGFGLSFLWKQETSVIQFINDVLSHIEGTLYVDRQTGKWKLTLARDDYDLEDLITLDESNIESLTNFKTKDLSELVNQVTVIFDDTEKGEQNSVTVQNRASIEQYGLVRSESYQFLGISNPELAYKVASRELRNTSSELFSCTIYTDRTASSLNIGDVFILNYTFKLESGDFSIENIVMRITDFEMGNISDNRIRINCIQDIFGTSNIQFTDATGGSGGGGGDWESPLVEPEDITTPILFEAPYYELAQILSDEEAQALGVGLGYAAITALEPTDGYFNFTILSDIGGTYEERGVGYFCATATIPAGVTMQDTSVVLADVVDIGVVSLNTYAFIRLTQTQCEIIKVTDLTQDIDTGAWTMTFERGCLDTVRKTHPADSRIYFVDEFVGSDEVAYLDGDTVNFKLIPTTGLGDLDESLATVRTLTFDARKDRPYPPAKIELNGVAYPTAPLGMANDVQIAWVDRNRLQQTASIIGDTEGAIPAEANTLYNIEIYQSDDTGTTLGSLVYSSYNIVQTSDFEYLEIIPAITFGVYNDFLTLVMWSERDGYESWQRNRITFIR